MTDLDASGRGIRSAVAPLTTLTVLLAAVALGNTPTTERSPRHARIDALVAAASPWSGTDPGPILIPSDLEWRGNLRSRFPANGDGSVEMVHRLSGLSLTARPKGLYTVRADGRVEQLAKPNPVGSHADADGGISYADVYPGVSIRYVSGPDHVRLEVIIENPVVAEQPRPGDTLQLRWQFELANGGLVVRMPAPAGGIVLLDDERNPVVWLTEPVMPFAPTANAGQSEPSSSVSYGVDVVQGRLEVSMTVAWESLIREGTAFPMIVHATTMAVAADR